MSRKDFILIAATINRLNVDASTKQTIAEAFASSLSTTNPAFKRYTFLDACLAEK